MNQHGSTDLMPKTDGSPVSDALQQRAKSMMRPLRAKIFSGMPSMVEKEMNDFFHANDIPSVSRVVSCGDNSSVVITIFY